MFLTHQSLQLPSLAACLFAGLTLSAQAAVTATDSFTTWAAAVPAAALVDFDDLPDATPVNTQYSGLVFSPLNSGVPIAAAENGPFTYPNVLSVDNPQLGGGGGVSIAFTSPRSAVAFQFSDSQFSGNTVTLRDATGAVLASWEMPYPHPTEWLFVGFTSSTSDIARIDVAMGDADRVTLDNLRFAAPVPEPASAWLLLAGAAVLARRRLRVGASRWAST